MDDFSVCGSCGSIKQVMTFSYSKLLGTRGNRLAPLCRNIHNKAQENLGAAREYGITAEMLAALQAAIDNFSAKTPQPRNAASIRTTLNGNLRELFGEADAILKDRLDRLVVNFKATEPDFVKTYESNLSILDPRTTATQLKGRINGATVRIVELSKTTTSAAGGKYTFKPINHGDYTITVTKPGFQDFQADHIDIKLGKVNNLNVELVNS